MGNLNQINQYDNKMAPIKGELVRVALATHPPARRTEGGV